MTEARKRPKDRKRQIVLAARDLFVEQGFPNVSMSLIAERLGITASALYRHFDNKGVLLQAVMAESFSYLETPPAGPGLESMVDEAIAIVAEHPYLADLWDREVRHLPEELQQERRAAMRRWARAFVEPVRAHRTPELGRDDDQLELIAWAIQSILSSFTSSAIHAPAAGRRAATRSAMLAVAAAPLGPVGEVDERPARGRAPFSRRERLLLAATEQFASQGYQETSMASIGAAADVTGPNLYGYFDGKADILRAAFERSIHVMWTTLDESLARSATAEEALEAVVGDFLRLVRERGPIQVGTTGAREVEEATRDAQREYVNEWTELLREVMPDLDRQQARLRTLVAIKLSGDLARTPHLARRARFTENLTALMLAVLRAPIV